MSRMAAALLLPRSGGRQRVVRPRGGSVWPWQCRDIRSRTVRHAPAPSTGAYWSSRHARWMVEFGTAKIAIFIPSYSSKLYPIVRMVCLSEKDSVIVFVIDEARRNLRPIQPRLSGIC